MNINSRTYSYLLGIAVFAFSGPISSAQHSGIVSIVSGSSAYQTCALLADNRLTCWGNENSARTLVDFDGKDVVAASLGFNFGCAIVTSGKVYCWGGNLRIFAGSNGSGQLGDGTTTSRTSAAPVKFSEFGHATSVSAGYQHACAILEEDAASVWCWGSNSNGQVGNVAVGKGNNTLIPVEVLVVDSSTSPPNPPLNHITSIALGFQHSCALLADNSGACWGGGYDGELGNGAFHTDYDWPQTVIIPDESGRMVPLIFGGGQIFAGQYHSCGLIADSPSNSVGCWGANGHGQLGDGTQLARSIAVASKDGLGKLTSAQAISGGYAFTCAIVSDRTLRCWGSDDEKELGRAGGGVSQASGVPILSDIGTFFGNVSQIAAGATHACALTFAGTVYCWGDGSYGQLGDSRGESDVPIPVSIDSPIFFDNFN